MTDPVVQLIDESNGEIVYTLRIKGTSWQPKVFSMEEYTVKIGRQGTGKMKTLTGIRPLGPDEKKTINVSF